MCFSTLDERFFLLAYPVCQGRTYCLVVGCIFGIIGGGISALAFAILHAHRVVMRFTTLRETWRLGIAMALKVIILYPLIHVFYPQVSNERLILGALLDMMTTTVVLVSVRVVLVSLYDFLKVRLHGEQKQGVDLRNG